MKPLALLLLLLLASDDLVSVAKESKEKKKKSTTKVITNADLKKAKRGKATTPAPAPKVGTSAAEEHEASQRDRLRREENLRAAQRKVAELESELRAIEQSYYDENDLGKRDGEIVRRFNEIKAKRDAARKVLDALAPPATST